MKFAIRLSNEEKLQSDFQHELRELNRRPQSRRFRSRERSRIGVGYRDKGTLPEESTGSRRRATEENFIFLKDLPEKLSLIIQEMLPACIEGEWVDLEILSEEFALIDELRNLLAHLNPL